jgi:hypothetical protein
MPANADATAASAGIPKRLTDEGFTPTCHQAEHERSFKSS